MDSQELQNLIKKLQTEIQNAKTINEEDQKLLAHLETEISRLLEKVNEKDSGVQPTTIKRLEDSVNQFEARHPTLTTLISQLLDDLSNAGI